MHLRAGDILVTVNGEYVVIEKIQHEILESPIKVYNFQVEKYHTYYVADIGVLVHNMCAKSYSKGLLAPKEFIGSPKNAKQVISYLHDYGFEVVSQRGSHIKLFNGSRTVIVPYHSGKEIKIGTLKSILKQAGLI